MQVDEFATGLLIEINRIALLWSSSEDDPVDLLLVLVQPILPARHVLAGLLYLLPRQTNSFLQPNSNLSVITAMEIVHNLVPLLREYLRHLLTGNLDYFGEINIFLVRTAIKDLIATLPPVLQTELDPVLLNLFERTVENGLATHDVLDAVGLVADRTIVGLESLLTRNLHL
jgi:hypothetical protein